MWEKDCGKAGCIWTLKLCCRALVLNAKCVSKWLVQCCQYTSMKMQWLECGGITAVWVLGVRQNKTTLDSSRLEVKLRDGNRGLSVTIKAQCPHEIRLGCSPKLCFLGMLLSLRLLEISSQLIKLCMSQKHNFTSFRTQVWTSAYFTETVITPTLPHPLQLRERARRGRSGNRLCKIRISVNSCSHS